MSSSLDEIAKLMAQKKSIKEKRAIKNHEKKMKDGGNPCCAGVKITKKAAKELLSGDDIPSVYVITYTDIKKDELTKGIFKQCSKFAKDDNEYCTMHQKRFDDDPDKVVNFVDEDCEKFLLDSDEHEFFSESTKKKKCSVKELREEINARESKLHEFTKFMEALSIDERLKDCSEIISEIAEENLKFLSED